MMKKEHSPGNIEGSQSPEKHEKLLEGKVVLVTGANRGIGAEITKALAREGATVIGPHRDEGKKQRAEKLENEVSKLGSELWSFTADITSQEGLSEVDAVLGWMAGYGGSVDILVHNAAGGLEDWATEEYAYKINAEAKSDLTKLVTDYVKEVSQREDKKKSLLVVDIPSLWSLEFGMIEQLPTYDLVAQTKYEGMRSLRKTVDELNQNEHNDVRLALVTGHGIGDTFTMRMFRRMAEEQINKVEQTATGGAFPTMQDMADAVVKVATTDTPDGHIEFVGIPNWDRETVKQNLNMYGDTARFIDSIVFFGDEGFAEYTVPDTYKGEPFTVENGALVNSYDFIDPLVDTVPDEREIGYHAFVSDQHTRGHFTEETGISLLPGHKQIAAMVQSAEMLYLDKLNGHSKPRISRLQNVRFQLPGFPNDTLAITAKTLNPNDLTGDSSITKNGKEMSSIDGITFHPFLWEEGDPRKKDITGDSLSYLEEIIAKEKAHETPEEIDTLTFNDMIEGAAQALGCTYLSKNTEGELLPLFEGLDMAEFASVDIYKGDTIRTHVTITESGSKGFTGNAEIYRDLEKVAEIQGLRCSIVPKDTIVRYFKRLQKK